MLWSSLVIYRVFPHFRWIPQSFQAHHWNSHGVSPRIATIQGADPRTFAADRCKDFLTSSRNHGPETKHLQRTCTNFGIFWNIFEYPENPVKYISRRNFRLQSWVRLVSASQWKERTALRLRRINTTSGWLVIPYLWPLVGMAAVRGSTQSTAHPHRSFDPSIYRGKSRASPKTFAGQIDISGEVCSHLH